MKKRVLSAALAAAALVMSLPAAGERLSSGPSCRSWLENPDLAKQQYAVGYLVGQAETRQTVDRSTKISLLDITEQDVFESLDRACLKMRGFPMTIAMQDVIYEMFALGNKRKKAYDEKRAMQR